MSIIVLGLINPEFIMGDKILWLIIDFSFNNAFINKYKYVYYYNKCKCRNNYNFGDFITPFIYNTLFLEEPILDIKGGPKKNDVVLYLVEKIKLDLPDEFLKRWLKVSNENKLSDEQIAEQYDDFAKNLKWTLM